MPAQRSKGRARGRPGRGRPQREKEPSSEPDVFQEMLAEVGVDAQASASKDGRVVKKRRVGGRLVVSAASNEPQEPGKQAPVVVQQQPREGDALQHAQTGVQQQTIYNDTEVSEDSDGDNWENVNLAAPGIDAQVEPRRETGDLSLDFDEDEMEPDQPSAQRRKPLTVAERKLRLEVHKMHILTLFSHVQLRNYWCNDLEIQASLRKLLPASTIKYLEDDGSHSQFQRSRSLTDGLEKASEVFRQHFEISARGMGRNYWAENAEQLAEFPIPDDIDLPVRKEDFRDLAKDLSASRDVGAQLFCAMLRSVDLDVRLVCSLQPLPFTGAAKAVTPVKPPPIMTVAVPETREGMTESESDMETRGIGTHSDSPNPKNYSSPGAIPKPVRRFGRAGFESKPPPKPKVVATPPKPKKKRIRESPYPVFWVEVFSPSMQKWLPVDPLVTRTIAKPSKFEPPLGDSENNMSYVIAFEEDGYAKDVTRRYAKAYNAKTRRSRVDSTKGGEKWWKRLMRMYKASFQLDRDQVENAELAQKEAQEPMPKNIQEFKNHPYYALERHLRRNEVLHPRRQVGKVSAGINKPLEPIYRRNDVHLVKSADSWFRLGREVKPDEEPLKVLEPRRKKQARGNALDEVEDPFADEDASEIPGQPMYAAFQTQQYIPPAVLQGRVPRNIFGNIDVYTNSMVPPGGVWIVHPFAGGAAKLLGVDCADAVTGFEFRGRTGTAVVKGTVVAGEYHEAVVETIKGFQYAMEEEESARRSEAALRAWKKFLTALRIKQRIAGYADDAGVESGSGSEYAAEEEDSGGDEGGGFLPDRENIVGDEMPQPRPGLQPIGSLEDTAPMSKVLLDAREPIVSTWGKALPPEPEPKPEQAQTPSKRVEEAGGFFVDEEEPLPDDTAVAPPGHYDAGGFLPAEDAGTVEQEVGGGFVPEPELPSIDEPPQPSSPAQPSETYKDTEDLRARGGFLSDPTEPSSSGAVDINAPDLSSSSPQPHTGDPHLEEGAAERRGKQPQAKDERPMEEDDEEAEVEAEAAAAEVEETGSLLSHDPEDEDATPEWLA